MLSKDTRVTTSRFKEIFDTGKTRRSGDFLIKFLPNTDRTTRAGVVVSKKVAKTAVERNKIKRTIYRLLQENKEALPYLDYIIFVQKTFLAKDAASRKESCQALLTELTSHNL